MSASSYRFGRFRLDPRSRELWAGDELVGIPPKSFDCLAYLIEHRDRAVGRDELISAVWGSTDVSDHSLAQTLLRARQVLGDTGTERTMIRTVPRFGHRWVAATESVDALAATTAAPETASAVDEIAVPATVVAEASVATAGAASAPAASPSPSPPSPRRPMRPAIIGVALLLSCAVAAFGHFLWRGRAATSVSPAVPATAAADGADLFVVMPVALSDESIENAWVRLGAMEYIATLLQQNAKQHVLPSDQVVGVVGAGRVDARDAAALARLRTVTGAAWIVIPRATASGSEWQVSLDVHHGDSLRRYDGAGSAPLPAARRAVIALMTDLGVADAETPQSPLPADELLQRIDAALLVGDLSQGRTLIESAPEAQREDPRFRTRAGTVAIRQGRLDDAANLYRPLAVDDITIALTERASAYMGLGAVAINRMDLDAAQTAYGKAIVLLRGSDDAHLLGRAYMGRGAVHASRNEFGAAMADFGQARVDLQRAGDRIGTASLEINVGMAEVNRGRFEQGIAAFDRAIPILTSFGVRDQLGISLHNKIYAQLSLLDVPGALATSQLAMDLVDQLANRSFARRIAAARGRALFTAGRLHEVVELFPRFDEYADDPAHSDTEFTVLRALLLAERRDYATLEAQGDAIVARVERSADMSGQALLSEAAWLAIDASLRVGKVDHAERLLKHLQAAPPAPEDLNRRVIEQLALAEVGQARHDPAAAQAFAAALTLADERGAPEPIILVATAWLPHLLAAGDLERAASVIGRLAVYVDRDYRAARGTAQLYRALGRTALAQDAEAKAARLAGERRADPQGDPAAK